MARLIDADELYEKVVDDMEDGDVLDRIPPSSIDDAPTIAPEIIQAESRMSYYHRNAVNEEELSEYVKADICNALARKLMDSDLVTLRRVDDSKRYELVYHGTVLVLKPEDAARFLYTTTERRKQHD